MPKDAIAVLKEDHDRIRELLSDLESTPEGQPRRRDDLLEEADKVLRTHGKAEEELFYPTYRDIVEEAERDIAQEAEEEHHVAEILLAELKGTQSNTAEFTGKAKALKDIIDHHMTEEEARVFPRVMGALTQEELENLGKEIGNREQELQQSYPRLDVRSIGAARTAASAQRRAGR